MSHSPFVYFDIVLCNGTMNGAIEVELGARVMTPGDQAPTITHVTTAHLRCSPVAAAMLIESLQKSLEMADALTSQTPPKIN